MADQRFGVNPLMAHMMHCFECGDKAVHIVNPEQREKHVQRLSEVGGHTAAVQKSGQLEIRSNTEAYLRDGYFDKERMLAAFAKMTSSVNTASRSIIEAHGGRMWATANDGPGATFAFSIPCEHIHKSRRERGCVEIL
jgi:light-regulated signal transduction histidine kinase (bacteriophytochrome)